MTHFTFDQWLNNIGKRPTLSVTLSILWLILIGWLAFFWHLGSISLIDETEPLFAEASRQMLVTGDWLTPYFNGETRFDKPSLIYWCQAIAYSIVGVNEWGVRLPSALAAMGLISLAFYTLQWHLTKKDELEFVFRPTRRWLIACLGAALMALNPQMIAWGRTGVSDMLLTGCVGSALLCFFLGYAQPHKSVAKTGWYLAFYVLTAAAILSKGPVGIVLPALAITLFVLYLGNFWEVLREMRLLIGMPIILGLSLPWYALVIWRHGPEYINSFFGYHNIERFTSVVNRHSAPWYFYFIVVLLGFAPYSVYLPLAIAKLKFWQRSYWRSQERSKQLGLFAFFWFVGVFGFFTIAITKLPSYVLPLMPASAILVALLWNDILETSSSSSSFLWTGWVNVAFVSAISVLFFYITRFLGVDPGAPNFRELLQQSGLPVLGGIIWLVCAVILAALLVRKRLLPLMTVNLLGFTVFLIFVLTPALFLMDSTRQLPLRQLSTIAVEVQQSGEELIMVGFKKPSIVFYTQRPVTFIRRNSVAGNYIQEKSAQKAQPQSVLVLAQPKKFPYMGLEPTEYQKLAQRGAYELIRVPLTPNN
jgi:4-amino-4-deoxy-L-arabinose transferase-like glycosyltransferase